jgi:hypothetical protein
MLDAEDLADLKEEVRKNIGAVKNHCPFGCPDSEMDEHGYCKHLVGFTNGSKVGDPLEVITVNPITEMCMVNGRHARKEKTYRGKGADRETFDVMPACREVVQKGDKLVNPEEVQTLDGGIRNVAKMWVSSRVYRDSVQRPRNPMPPPEKERPDFEAMLAAELESVASMKDQLRKEIDDVMALKALLLEQQSPTKTEADA